MKVYADVLNPDRAMIDELKRLGLGLEFSYFTDPANYAWDNLKRGIEVLEYAADQLRYPPIFHGPYMSMVLGARDPLVREAVTERLNGAYKIAENCGCEEMVIHGGYTLPYHDDETVEKWAERCADHLKHTDLYGGRTTVSIENVREQSPEIINRLIRKLPGWGICLDTGHVNIFADDKDLIFWAESCGEMLRTVHLHFNEGERDQHLSHVISPAFETFFHFLDSHTNGLKAVIEVCSMDEFRKSFEDLSLKGMVMQREG